MSIDPKALETAQDIVLTVELARNAPKHAGAHIWAGAPYEVAVAFLDMTARALLAGEGPDNGRGSMAAGGKSHVNGTEPCKSTPGARAPSPAVRDALNESEYAELRERLGVNRFTDRVFEALRDAGPGWRTMESAPKDTVILVAESDGEAHKVSWGDCCPGYPNSPRMRWCVAWTHGEHGYHIVEDPVAWMPLPALEQ